MTDVGNSQSEPGDLLQAAKAQMRHFLTNHYLSAGRRKDAQLVLQMLHDTVELLHDDLLHDWEPIVEADGVVSLYLHFETGERFDVLIRELSDD